MNGLWPLHYMAGLYALLSILAYYLCWIIKWSDCGMNRRDDDALLFAGLLRRIRKEATILSPLARQTVRDTSPMFRGGVRSLMQFTTVRAPVRTERRLMRLDCTNGDECGGKS